MVALSLDDSDWLLGDGSSSCSVKGGVYMGAGVSSDWLLGGGGFDWSDDDAGSVEGGGAVDADMLSIISKVRVSNSFAQHQSASHHS